MREEWTAADETSIQGSSAIQQQKKDIHEVAGSLNTKYIQNIIQIFHSKSTQQTLTIDNAITLDNSYSLRKFSSIARLIGLTYGNGESDVYNLFQKIYDVSTGDASNFYEKFNQNLINKLKGEGYPNKQITTTIYKNHFQNTNPLYFDYFQGWRVFEDSYRGIIFGILVFLSIRLSTIFTYDKDLKTNPLIMTSKQGKEHIASAKIGAGMLFTSIIYFIIIALASIFLFSIYGITGWNASIQFLHMSSFQQMDFFSLYLHVILRGWILSLVSAAITMYFSEKSKSSFKVTLAVCLMILIPYFVNALQSNAFINGIMSLFPIVQTDVSQILTSSFIIFDSIAIPVPLLILSFLIVLSIFLLFRIENNMRNRVEN